MGIGRKIAEIRKGIGLSQMELCLKAGLDKSYISRIENEHSSPTFEMVERILKSMGLDMGFLTTEDDMSRFTATHELLAPKPKNKLFERLEECFERLNKDSQKTLLTLAEQLSRVNDDSHRSAA